MFGSKRTLSQNYALHMTTRLIFKVPIKWKAGAPKYQFWYKVVSLQIF